MTLVYISLLVLIVSLSAVGIMLHKSKGSSKYPPEIPSCPDFWEVKGLPDNIGMSNPNPELICMPNLGDKVNVGSFAGKEFDFGTPEFRGPSGNMKKCQWANSYGIFWDGITTGEPCLKLKK